MDTWPVLGDHQPGYLVVMDDSPQMLLSLHVGTYGNQCDEVQLAATARDRCLVLWKHPHNYETKTFTAGSTSSDVAIRHAGAVAASNLAIGYASRDGGSEPLGDEAVAIMIAVRAGLLPKSAIKNRYGNRSLKEHNPHLREIIDATTTWWRI